MADLVQQRKVDDLEYRRGEKVDSSETVRFGLDGKDYDIDLCEENADQLRSYLAEFVAAAKLVTKAKSTSTTRARREETKMIRVWARARGIKISDRGRIPKEVRNAYLAERAENDLQMVS